MTYILDDDGSISIWGSDMGEVCIQVRPGADARQPYAAFTTDNARQIAKTILALADLMDAERDTGARH